MSEKSSNKSWISQFGLYRYEDNLRKRKKQSSICFYGITGIASIVIVIIFIFITNTDFEPPKRLIIFSQENKSISNILPTESFFLPQIPSQYDKKTFTTPLSIQESNSEHAVDIEGAPLTLYPQKLEFKSYRQALNDPDIYISNHNIYPNHRSDIRRELEEIYPPRPFDYILKGTPPTPFRTTKVNTSNFPRITKEYVGNVDSIQDILRQVRDNVSNNSEESSGHHKIKIAGTYRHPKVNDITTMFESKPRETGRQHLDQSLQTNSLHSPNVIKDPFYKFKPNSLSDVNLLATKQFRFAPYTILNNNLVRVNPSYTQASMNSDHLYSRIIAANKNRLKYANDNSKNDYIQVKQKPFTLMLDVYPMTDDEHVPSPTSYQPVKFRKPISSSMIRHPGINSINHLQSSLHNINFPQLKTRYPNMHHYHNDMYFRKFATKLNSGEYNEPVDDNNNPGQITVHLNLYPKKKNRYDNRKENSEFLNREETNFSEKDDSNLDIKLQERMAKLKDNKTKNQDFNNQKLKNIALITNKVDMDVFQNATDTNGKRNVIIVDDENSDDIDSGEEVFNKEFLQFYTTESTTEMLQDTTPLVSFENDQPQSIPTTLPIEPRGYSHKLDTSLFSLNNKKKLQKNYKNQF